MRILHLEDNDHDAELIGASLIGVHPPCEIIRVSTARAFSEALEGGGWTLLLADYSLPSFDGLSALRMAVRSCPETPFVFVSGTLGEEQAIAALKGGATDHVLKHRLDRLPAVVTRAIQERETVQKRRDAEEAVRNSLRETTSLLQEVHHRVNNNFQIICSLLNLQATGASDPLLAAGLQQSLNRVQAMARVHAMLYDATSLQDIDFATYVRRTVNDIQETCPGSAAHKRASTIGVVLNLTPARLEIDRAIPCGLILNELLSNAFGHAFPESRHGEVRISLNKMESGVLLTVEDTGVGMPEGFRLAEARSVGFSIVRILTRQIRGSMQFSFGAGQGSRFELSFE